MTNGWSLNVRRRMRTVCFGLLALLAGAPAAAQSVGGRVLDNETRQGVQGVRVTLQRPNGPKIDETVTDRDGRFAVRAKNSGLHRLQTQHIGYRGVTTVAFDVGGLEQVIVDITITTAAVQLEPLTIVARRHDSRHDATEDGLYARRLTTPFMGTSRVVLPHDPEMMNALDARDVLTWLKVPTTRRACTVVYWNGHMVLDSTTARLRLEESTSNLEAVEYYRNPQDAPIAYRDTPLYLQSNVYCDIVALWPRTGRYLSVPPAPLGPEYGGYASFSVAATHLSGPESPGVGVGFEAAGHLPIRGSFGLGLFARLSKHSLSAESTATLTRDLGVNTFVLPAGERPLRLFVAGLEPRMPIVDRVGTRVTLGLRVQMAQRSFSIEKPAIGSKPFGVKSLGYGGGPTVSLESLVGRRFALNATMSYDRLVFDGYQELERSGNRTDANWNALTLRIGLLVNAPW